MRRVLAKMLGMAGALLVVAGCNDRVVPLVYFPPNGVCFDPVPGSAYSSIFSMPPSGNVIVVKQVQPAAVGEITQTTIQTYTAQTSCLALLSLSPIPAPAWSNVASTTPLDNIHFQLAFAQVTDGAQTSPACTLTVNGTFDGTNLRLQMNGTTDCTNPTPAADFDEVYLRPDNPAINNGILP